MFSSNALPPAVETESHHSYGLLLASLLLNVKVCSRADNRLQKVFSSADAEQSLILLCFGTWMCLLAFLLISRASLCCVTSCMYAALVKVFTHLV